MPSASTSPAATIDPIGEKGRAFVGLLAAGKNAEAVASFDATMKKGLPEEKLAETWSMLTVAAGAFESIEGVTVEPVGAYKTALVTCKFARTRLDAKIAYDKDGKVAGLFFVPSPEPYADPAYVDRSKFDEREVTIGSGEFQLPGTLAIPKGAGPFRAVVLVHGSGPNDRDESSGPNRPFKDLSGGLASRGIAVLRFEKRTKVHGEKLAKLKDATVDHESVDDAVLAVELLRGMKEIDGAHIVVAGHSLGGQLAPRIAARSKDVAAVAILAGSTRPVYDAMVEQMKYIAGLDGRRADEETKQIEEVEKAGARIRAIQAGAPEREGEVLLGAMAPYWIDMGKYDALSVAAKLERPMFVAQGGRDYQVTKTDFEAWKRALASRKDVRYALYPELNHLFGAGEGKSSPEEYQRRTPVDPRLVDDLSAWLLSL